MVNLQANPERVGGIFFGVDGSKRVATGQSRNCYAELELQHCKQSEFGKESVSTERQKEEKRTILSDLVLGVNVGIG